MRVRTLESAAHLQWAGQGGEPGAPQKGEKYPGQGSPTHPTPNLHPRRPCVYQWPLLDAWCPVSLRPQPWLPFLEPSTARMIRPVEPRCHELSQPQVSRLISKLGTFCCKGAWQRWVGRPCWQLRSVVVKLN